MAGGHRVLASQIQDNLSIKINIKGIPYYKSMNKIGNHASVLIKISE